MAKKLPEKKSNTPLQEEEQATPQAKGVKPLLIAALVVGAVSAPIGWFLGQQTSHRDQMNASAQRSQAEAAEQTHKQTNDEALIPLPAILTNLREPEKIRVRMEISLVTQEPGSIDSEHLAEISNDFVALLRQLTLLQIKGPTGLMNLREDLLERAKIRSEGKVSALLISHLVIE